MKDSTLRLLLKPVSPKSGLGKRVLSAHCVNLLSFDVTVRSEQWQFKQLHQQQHNDKQAHSMAQEKEQESAQRLSAASELYKICQKNCTSRFSSMPWSSKFYRQQNAVAEWCQEMHRCFTTDAVDTSAQTNLIGVLCTRLNVSTALCHFRSGSAHGENWLHILAPVYLICKQQQRAVKLLECIRRIRIHIMDPFVRDDGG